jgi:hypothetical protein
MALAAAAAGAHGLIIEVYPEPDTALSDGPQSLTLDGFAWLMRSLEQVLAVSGRRLASPRPERPRRTPACPAAPVGLAAAELGATPVARSITDRPATVQLTAESGAARIGWPDVQASNSRWPSALTPTAITTATGTMRPCWRTFRKVTSSVT